MVDQFILNRISELYPRKIDDQLQQDLINGHRVTVLLGSRQIGKTSLMYRLMDYLINSRKIDPHQIEYLDLEFPQILSQVNGLYGQDFLDYLAVRGMDTSQKCYIFIDEIHYMDEPSSFLKTMNDHFPQVVLVVTGSSSLQIQKKFKDALTGRKSVVHVSSLDFSEFLDFKKSDLSAHKAEISINSIIESGTLPDRSHLRFLEDSFQKEYKDFIVWGGYPKITMLNILQEKMRLLEEIYQSYVMKDIKDVAKIENITAFNNMIELLSHQTGSLINIAELCVALGIARPTVEHYLYLLEQTFILTAIRPFFTNKRKEIVKSSKVYFDDTGLRNVAARNFDSYDNRPDKGALFENAVFSQLKKNRNFMQTIHYYRTKGKSEVDFILKGKDIIPIEVKSGTFKQPKIPSSLKAFINSYKPEYAFVVNRDYWAEEKLNTTTIFFIPAWAV